MKPFQKGERHTRLHFRTERQSRQIRQGKIWIIFTAVFLVIAIASFSVIWRDLGLGRHFQKNTIDTSKTNMKSNFNLLIGGATTEGNLVFMTRLHVETATGEMHLQAYDPSPYNRTFGGEHADEATEEAVVSQFAKHTNQRIDRYLFLKEPNAANVGYLFGSIEERVPNDIDYSSKTFSLHLMKGKQILSGSDVFNLLRYYGLKGDRQGWHAQEKLLASFLSQVLTPDNAANGQSIFEDLTDDTDTNLSINDYMNYDPLIDGVAKGSHNVKIG